MKIAKTTPILCVASIEESLPFWTKILGYEKTVEVPHQGKLGFVILQKDGSEIMLQTHPSMVDDLPEVAKHVKGGSICLYSDVDSLQKTLGALKNVKPGEGGLHPRSRRQCPGLCGAREMMKAGPYRRLRDLPGIGGG